MNDIISDEIKNTVLFAYSRVLSPVLQFFAVLANVLNVMTFCKLGLKDGVNVTLLALSLSDAGYVAFDVINTASFLIAASPWQLSLPVSLMSLTGCLHWYQYVFLDTSTFLETYLAVARCCCVAMPLKFKNVFTVKTSAAIILASFSSNVVFRIPLFSSYGLSWQLNPSTNLTKLMFYSGADFTMLNTVEQILGRTVCPVVFLCISMLCSVILTRTLVSASARRKEMTSGATAIKTTNQTQGMGNLSMKELQIVKAVTIVIVTLCVLMLLLSTFSLSQAAVPELFPGKRYRNLHGAVMAVLNLLVTFHASYKIIIYYQFNSKFRTVLKTFYVNLYGVLFKSSPI